MRRGFVDLPDLRSLYVRRPSHSRRGVKELRPPFSRGVQPGKPAAHEGLPVVTYDNAVTIHVNGEHVRLLPIRNAHTDGDTLVYFPAHDILSVGDYFRSTGYPVADLTNGGSLNGLLEGLGATIGRAGPNTKVIPGHGPIADRNALIAQHDLILAVRDKVSALIDEGKTLEETIAAKPTAEFDAKVPQAEQTSERFVKWLYAEVKASKGDTKPAPVVR